MRGGMTGEHVREEKARGFGAVSQERKKGGELTQRSCREVGKKPKNRGEGIGFIVGGVDERKEIARSVQDGPVEGKKKRKTQVGTGPGPEWASLR